MADILVTGGRGFIGTNLTQELRSRDHQVWTCDILQCEDPQHFKADVSVYQQMDAIFRQHHFDYVYHLAAEMGHAAHLAAAANFTTDEHFSCRLRALGAIVAASN